MLGSPSVLKQTRKLLADEGAELQHFMTHSPKCTPSRTGQLVGRHYHNVRPVAAETTMVEVLEDGTTAAPQGGGLNQTTMFEPTALFPMLKAAGYWTSIVGKVHNSQGGWLCKPGHNRTDAFTHISTVCGPCGNYFPNEFVVKEVGEPTTRLVALAHRRVAALLGLALRRHVWSQKEGKPLHRDDVVRGLCDSCFELSLAHVTPGSHDVAHDLHTY